MASASKWVTAACVSARNLALGGSVASLSLLGKPRTFFEYATESLFLYRSLSGKRGVPEKFVFEVLPGNRQYELAIANFQCEEGWMRRTGSYSTDLISLCQLCHVLNPKTIFEIGTLRGYTALHLAMNSSPDCRIFTLDLPKSDMQKGDPSKDNSPKDAKVKVRLRTTLMDDLHSQMEVGEYYFRGTPHADRIQLLFGDSAVFDFSPHHGKVDLFFIDGAHSYDYVRSDTENALQCIRPGGVIAWHDFGRVGLNQVSKYILELSRKLPIYSVPGGSLAFAVL
ncbi:MAG: class I SAM-dependent methyltransferase [Candidatus Sulfotelmatobacter sp.]